VRPARWSRRSAALTFQSDIVILKSSRAAVSNSTARAFVAARPSASVSTASVRTTPRSWPRSAWRRRPSPSARTPNAAVRSRNGATASGSRRRHGSAAKPAAKSAGRPEVPGPRIATPQAQKRPMKPAFPSLLRTWSVSPVRARSRRLRMPRGSRCRSNLLGP
jgi:hypothetical protein